ncbi:hypothetical protein [Chitinophaga sp. CF418]|uniref:hypothetical protein n=1 Tax=Chitinophaga sp. CF418 TaxID=1855287 RepID=UPI00122CCA06|nr:hypothetical protein [Chitinophaga sp. CF418]
MASCKEVRRSIDETLHPVPQKKQAPSNSNASSSSTVFSSSTVISSVSEEVSKSIFENAATLDSIQQALHDLPHLKGKKLFFMAGFYFYDYRGGMISIDLQDPDIPGNVDTYTYSNGAWEIQKPVKIAGNQHFPLEMLLMSLDEVKFSTAKKVYDIAVEKSKTMEGAETIQFVYFSQIKTVHVKEWYIMIQAARRNYRITFDVNGNLRGMN